MQMRDARFRLRYESGERQGEEIPLPEGKVTLGRRAENQVVVADSSVSGRHAELLVAGGRVAIRDLGSTNGTRVGGKKVEEATLAHGDALTIGHVHFAFLDAELSGPAPAPVASTAAASPAAPSAETPPETPPETIGHVSAERVAKSGKRGFGALVVIVVALAGGGYYLWSSASKGKQSEQVTLVREVPGNLLPDASFEGNEETWESADAPGFFFRDGVFAASGKAGLGVDLEADGWALTRSPWVPLGTRGLGARVTAWTEEGCEVRLGLELARTGGDAAGWIVWAPAVRAEAPEELTLDVPQVPGYDRARLVLAARGAGRAAFDDAVLLPDAQATAEASFHEYTAYSFGGASTAAIARAGRTVLVASLDGWSAAGLEGEPTCRWRVEEAASGLRLFASEAPREATLSLLLPRRESDEDSAAWLATVGPDGYASQTNQFDAARVASLLLGRGGQLARVGFEQPLPVEGNLSGGAMRLRVALPAGGGPVSLDVQLAFSEERARAVALAQSARDAARRGLAGTALAAWVELLDRYPFDGELVREAEAARGELVHVGLDEVEAWRGQFERAHFFQLADLFEACRDGLAGIAERYAGTTVETEARTLLVTVEEALAAVSRGDGDHERLAGVLEALDPAAAPQLYEHVRAALNAREED